LEVLNTERMKPLAIQIGRRIVLIIGSPRKLVGVAVAKSPVSNLVLVKVELDP
jgi:hypothetical protein